MILVLVVRKKAMLEHKRLRKQWETNKNSQVIESFVIGGQIKGFMCHFAKGMTHCSMLLSFIILVLC